MKRSMLALLLPVAVLVRVPDVRAGSDAEMKQGEAIYQEAATLFDHGQYEAACEKFRDAYRLTSRPGPLFNLAVTEQKLGRDAASLHDFRRFTRLPAADAKYLEQARAYIRELAPRVATFAIEAPPGTAITIDGQPNGDATPALDAIDVAPGRHTIEARRGAASSVRIVDATAGETGSLRFDLPESGSAAEPVSAPPAAPGAPPSDAATPLPSPRAPSPSTGDASPARTWVPVGLGAAALVAAGVGVGFTLGTDSASRREDGLQHGASSCLVGGASCAQLNDAAQARARDRGTAIGLYVGAGALAATAIAVWLAWPKAVPSAAGGRIRVAPLIGAREHGLSMAIDF